METPEIVTALGTVVEQVERYTENPADNAEHQILFHDGWWQVVVAGDGRNPAFPAQKWGIIFVAPKRRDVKLNFNDDELTVVLVEPDVEVVKVTTVVEVREHDGIEWEFPIIIVGLRSKTRGDDSFKFLCGEPEPICKPDRSKFN